MTTCTFCTRTEVATYVVLNRFNQAKPCCTTCFHAAQLCGTHTMCDTKRTMVAV